METQNENKIEPENAEKQNNVTQADAAAPAEENSRSRGSVFSEFSQSRFEDCIFECRGVNKNYDKFAALTNVNLRVPRGGGRRIVGTERQRQDDAYQTCDGHAATERRRNSD